MSESEVKSIQGIITDLEGIADFIHSMIGDEEEVEVIDHAVRDLRIYDKLLTDFVAQAKRSC